MAWLASMGCRRVPGLLDGLRKPRAELRPTRAWPVVPHLDYASAYPDQYFVHGHVPADLRLPDGIKVVTIMRHPRNVLVSYARWRGLEDLTAILRGGFRGHPFVEAYRRFLGWRGRGPVIRYEDLPPGFTAGAPDLYAGAAEDHNTQTGSPSDWREVWTPELETAWQKFGGLRLEADAGYW